MILAAGSTFDPIYNFFGGILAFFYSIVPNLGISIILLTVVVMLALFPLTAKQAKSMLAMQRAQPEIKKLQAKYKNDRAKLNEETMKFYQENKINPLSGCLPLLVQMPIFLTLYRVMREPYKHIPKGSDLYAAFCTSHGHLHVKACNLPKAHPPLPRPQYFLGMDLSLHATAVSSGFMDALPYFLLVGLVIVTGFAQARQSRRNSPNMNAQMAMITNIMPIGFGLFSLQFPAGLVLYFLVSNLWRLGQQELIMHKITRPGQAALAASGNAIDVDSKEKAPPAEPRAPGGLRKLFQLPAASPDRSGGPDGSGEANGSAEANGTNGSGPSKAAKPAGPAKPAAGKSGSAAAAGKGASGSGAARSGSGAAPTGGATGSARRRNNKKRKRR
jgi:YidC/Oxa1 family membrane protein insertase